MEEELKEFEFNFDVMTTYSKIIKATNLAEAMQEFKKWWKNDSNLSEEEIQEEDIYQINSIWHLKDGKWEDCFEWGMVPPFGGCTVENFGWRI